MSKRNRAPKSARQERYIIRRDRRNKNLESIMRADKSTNDARSGQILEPYSGETHSFQPSYHAQTTRRINFEAAKRLLQDGAHYERGDYGTNLIVENGMVWGNVTDTDARRLNLI